VPPDGGEDGSSRASWGSEALKDNEGTGISVNVTASEFYQSFASIFRLSDGSRISMPTDGRRIESLRYMQEILHAVGVHVNESASRESPYPGDILQICGKVCFFYRPRCCHTPNKMHAQSSFLCLPCTNAPPVQSAETIMSGRTS
jgi:hypothetical protein